MKKGTIVGIIVGLVLCLLVGGVIGVMAMRIYMLEESIEASAVTVGTPQGQEPAVQPTQPQTASQPQSQTPVSNHSSHEDDDHHWVDVETEVSRIRAIYNDTVANMQAGRYTERSLGQGVVAYSDGRQIKCVVVPRGVYGMDYSRWYYYEGDDLIFAYYEAEDAHRFYFYDGDLMRWRYCADASNRENAVNEDWGTSPNFCRWEEIVENEGEAFVD